MVLLRYPGLLVALVVGAFLLSLTVSAYPLFLDGSASELLREEITAPLVTPHGAGVTYESSNVPLGAETPGDPETPLYVRRGEVFVARAERSPHLGDTLAGTVGPVVTLAPRGRRGDERTGRLFAGTEATAHIDVIAGREGSGVWLPDSVARPLRIRPGERVAIGYEAATIEVAVDGVYRSLYSQPRQGYWRRWDAEIFPLCEVGRGTRCAPPPQFVLLDGDTAIETMRALGVPSADFSWEAPLRSPDLAISEAREVSAFIAELRADAADPGGELGRVLRCCFSDIGGLFGQRTRISTGIDTVILNAEGRMAAVEGPSRLLEIVAVLVALAVVAAGGAFGAAARRTEARLLLARGRGPAVLAAKAAAESALPALLGAVLGFGAAILLIDRFGPGGRFGRGAVVEAMLGSAVVTVLGVVVVSLASAATSLSHSDYHRSRFGVVAHLPWELLLVGVSLYALREVRAEIGGADFRTLGEAPPTLLLFLLPIAFIGGLSMLAARAFRSLARIARSRSERLRPPSYLAVHRLADATGLALLLFAASGLAIGIFVQGQTLVSSLDRTVDAKAEVFVGSDVQAWVSPDTAAPEDPPLPATRVVRVPEAGTILPGDVSFDLLAVDPSSLPEAAFWNDAFADAPFAELVQRLESPGAAAPVVVVASTADVSALEMKQRTFATATVGHATAFPGMVSRRPMIVVDQARLERAYEGVTGPLDDSDARTEVWFRGNDEVATAAAYQLEFPPYSVFGVEDVKDIPYIEAVVDMFAILDVLGIAASLLVVVALVMYLQARQRSQLVAYGLSRRMGMGPGAHRRSLVGEVGSVLVASFMVGAGLAVVVAVLVLPLLDPLPSVPPDPFVTPPLAVVGAALVGIAISSWAAGRITEARARRHYLGEVLRVDE